MASTSDSTSHWAAITPSDTVNFRTDASNCNFLYIGVTGNISVQCDGVAILFSNVPVGYHPIRCSRVNNTGTTASAMNVAY